MVYLMLYRNKFDTLFDDKALRYYLCSNKKGYTLIYPNNFEEKVGFERIRQLTERYCSTELAKDKLRTVNFSTSYEWIIREVNLVDELRLILMMEEGFPQSGYVNVDNLLKKLTVIGTFLDAEEMVLLRSALEVVNSIVTFLNNTEDGKYPYLLAMSEGITSFPQVVADIDRIIDRFGRVKDNASPKLQEIRREIHAKESQISRRMAAILKNAQAEGFVDEDVQISIREGRPVIPVSAANKRKIRGFVHDESATGKTFYVEPIEVVELNNEIKELRYEERREIIVILTTFADKLRPILPDLMGAVDYMATVDFIKAKAKLALDIDGAKPILVDYPNLSWRNARHPILMLTLRKEGKEVVPLNIELTKENHLLLISGPNAGGKSVCLTTVGLLQYMLQCGFLVPLSAISEMGIFESLFIDIGDEQNLENDLSTYSSHLLNMKMFLRGISDKSVILIDEFGSGTEPTVGGAIAESLLGQFVEKKTFGVVTTHFSNLKYYAAETKGIVNGAMMFDVHKIQPLFKLEMGKPGSSFAFEIARKIGLPESVLTSAAEKVGDDYVNMEKQLRQIARDRNYWESKRDKIKRNEKRLEELVAKYEKDLSEIKDLRKDVVDKARQEAKVILADANKSIERTIREIKESNAEKEKTRMARRQFEEAKEKIEEETSSEDERIARKMEQLRQREERKGIRIEQGTKAEPKKANKPLEIGDKVKLKGQDAVGEITQLSGKNATVAFGHIFTSVKVDKLERASNAEYQQKIREDRTVSSAVVEMSTRRNNFKSNVDLRGMRADEALEVVRDLVDEAIMLSISDLRILHGKGNGILKQLIRDYLKTVGLVQKVADEREELGGAGITVVKLDV